VEKVFWDGSLLLAMVAMMANNDRKCMSEVMLVLMLRECLAVASKRQDISTSEASHASGNETRSEEPRSGGAELLGHSAINAVSWEPWLAEAVEVRFTSGNVCAAC